MKLDLPKEKMDFLQSIGVENREYTLEELDDIVIDAVSDHLQMHGFAAGQEGVNAVGDMCERIIDDIVDLIAESR